MNPLPRTFAAMALATGFCVLPALQADAAGQGATKFTYVEDYDETAAMLADENPCGPWDGVLHEIRHGVYNITAAPGGQVDGEYHVNGVVDGWVAFDPDSDGPLPTYTGSYREKDNVIVTGEDDSARIVQFRLRIPASAANGSTLLIVLTGKQTVNAHGVTTVSRNVATCSFG